MNITELKQTFRNLNRLNVKLVTLPKKEYFKTKRTFRLNSDDGGSHHQIYDEGWFSVFGVRVEYDTSN
jgi:hypothetical protein